MGSTAVPSQGIQLKRSVASVYTLISEVHNLQAPQEKNPVIDVTSFDDSDRKRISGALRDGGTITFDFWWKASDAQQLALRTSLVNGTKEDFQIVLPDPGGGNNHTTYQFFGFVDMFSGPKASVGAALTGSAQITITGAVTLTAAS